MANEAVGDTVNIEGQIMATGSAQDFRLKGDDCRILGGGDFYLLQTRYPAYGRDGWGEWSTTAAIHTDDLGPLAKLATLALARRRQLKAKAGP